MTISFGCFSTNQIWQSCAVASLQIRFDNLVRLLLYKSVLTISCSCFSSTVLTISCGCFFTNQLFSCGWFFTNQFGQSRAVASLQIFLEYLERLLLYKSVWTISCGCFSTNQFKQSRVVASLQISLNNLVRFIFYFVMSTTFICWRKTLRVYLDPRWKQLRRNGFHQGRWVNRPSSLYIAHRLMGYVLCSVVSHLILGKHPWLGPSILIGTYMYISYVPEIY